MAQILKADTSVKVRIGPFVDVGDGFTPETAIGNTPTNLTGVDEAELLKANGAATSDITTRTWAAVTGCDGWYDLTLTTGDTDTEGDLTIVIQDDDVCLPVFVRFQVVNANVYDSLFAAATTDYLQVDAIQVSGDATAADNLELDYDGTGYNKSNSTIGTTTTNTDLVSAATIADAVWDEAATGHTDAGKAGEQLWTDVDAILVDTGTTLDGRIPAALVGGRIDATVDATGMESGAKDAIADSVWDEARADHVATGSFGQVHSGILEIQVDNTSFTATTTQLQSDTAGLDATDDHYNGRILVFIDDGVTNDVAGQATDITNYDGTNKRFTYTALTNAPSDNHRAFIV